MSRTSLWPELPIATKPRGMRQMLTAAGADIREQTKDIVHFHVVTEGRNKQGELEFVHYCRFYIPSAGGLMFDLLQVQTGPTAFPAKVEWSKGSHTVENEEQLRQKLAEIFQSEHTKQLLLNLIANFDK